MENVVYFHSNMRVEILHRVQQMKHITDLGVPQSWMLMELTRHGEIVQKQLVNQVISKPQSICRITINTQKIFKLIGQSRRNILHCWRKYFSRNLIRCHHKNILIFMTALPVQSGSITLFVWLLKSLLIQQLNLFVLYILCIEDKHFCLVTEKFGIFVSSFSNFFWIYFKEKLDRLEKYIYIFLWQDKHIHVF